jgi:hypothetical protein
MTNQQGWKMLSTVLAGKVLTAQVLNATFNAKFGTTGDHYPGDYAFVKDAKGKLVAATNTQAAGGYDAIFVRTTEAATYRVLAPSEQMSNPRAGKGRGRGANLIPDAKLKDIVASLLSAQPDPEHIPAKHDSGNGATAQ